MLFASLTFLSFFLPMVVAGYFLLRGRTVRNIFLLIVSLFFYAWGEPFYILLMMWMILVTYTGGLMIGHTQNQSIRNGILALTIIIDLFILFHYKYTDFARQILYQVGWMEETFSHTVLPVGISFYTFQAVSYLIDIWKKETAPARNILKTALYISFFPQLIAGPILKYRDVCAQIDCRRETISDFAAGLRRFIAGLAKKVLIANVLGEVTDLIFTTQIHTQFPSIVWGAVLFYALQLYFDFSGYSDMALGLGRMFGFHFPENFNYPYVSRSVTELWRRWHISLSGWFREYVYIPLGGNRRGLPRTIFNLSIVFLLTGLWHGAAWTFIVWGVYQGFFVIMEKLGRVVFPKMTIPKGIAHFYLLFIFVVGMVFFRAETMPQAIDCLRVMFGLTDPTTLTGWGYYFTPFRMAVFCIACVLSTGICRHFHQPAGLWRETAANIWCIGLLILCYAFLCAASFNPFIYFRF